MNERKAVEIFPEESNLHYSFDRINTPIAHAKDGDLIVFHTLDASHEMVNCTGEVDLNDQKRKKFLPLTGPVFIDDCTTNDSLCVEIKKIHVNDFGHLWSRPGNGVLSLSDSAYSLQVSSSGNTVCFSINENTNLFAPMNKMVGIIGVAPTGDAVKGNTPGSHGGNLDSVFVKEGAVIHFPVNTDGALLSMGDLHAAMGEGELCGTGVEINGDVECIIRIDKGKTIKKPWIEYEGNSIFLSSGSDYSSLIKELTEQGTLFLAKKYNIPEKYAYLILSATSSIRIAQVVNPLLTLSLIIPEMEIK